MWIIPNESAWQLSPTELDLEPLACWGLGMGIGGMEVGSGVGWVGVVGGVEAAGVWIWRVGWSGGLQGWSVLVVVGVVGVVGWRHGFG